MLVRVRMRVAISGTRNGVPWPAAGGVVELPDGEAAALLAAGLAEPAPEEAEAAVDERPAETATAARRPRGRR